MVNYEIPLASGDPTFLFDRSQHSNNVVVLTTLLLPELSMAPLEQIKYFYILIEYKIYKEGRNCDTVINHLSVSNISQESHNTS